MISLALAIIMAVVVKFVYKYIEGKDIDGDSVMVINYVTTMLITLTLCFQNHVFSKMEIVNSQDLCSLLEFSLKGELSVGASFIWCIGLGIFQAIMLVYNFLAIRKGIVERGASMTTVFSSIGNMMTFIALVVIFKEIPSSIQWVGIGLAFGAIALSNLDFEHGIQWNFKIVLLMITFMTCVMGVNYKFIQTYTLENFDSFFLFISFSLSLFISLFHFRNKKCRYRWKEIIFGIIIGIPNIASSYYLMNSLKTIPATLAYPINSAGSIVVTVLICALYFKEKLKKNELIAVVMTILGVIFINV